MYNGYHVKNPPFLSDFNDTNGLDRFSKNYQIQNFIKLCPEGAETDRQTDRTKLTVTFRNFANAPKNIKYYTPFMITAQNNS